MYTKSVTGKRHNRLFYGDIYSIRVDYHISLRPEKTTCMFRVIVP